jgi:hypothetical protein
MPSPAFADPHARHDLAETLYHATLHRSVSAIKRMFQGILFYGRFLELIHRFNCSELSTGEYHKASDLTLESILEVLETIGDEYDIDGYDVEYSVRK